MIDFSEFCEYLRRYSEHHLEEQPSLEVYLSDTALNLQKELDKLAQSKQVVLTEFAIDKKSIIVVAFFIEKVSERYKEIRENPLLPFPTEADIPKKIPREIVTKKNATEFIQQALQKEELNDKYLYGIELPHNIPTILLPSTISIMTLVDASVIKIQSMLARDEHHDYFMKKVAVSNPGREISAKNFFNKFVDHHDDGMRMVKTPDDTFYFMSQLFYFIKQDYEKVKDYTQEDISILQAVYILEISGSYFKSRIQEDSKRDNALKSLEQQMNKPPYYFSYYTITKFSNQSGIPLLQQYSEDDLKSYLHSKSTESESNQLPDLLIFKAGDNEQYFIFKSKVMPLISRLCTDARDAIKDTIKKSWFAALKSFYELPEMKDQRAFERRLENELETQFPILYALLNVSFLPLISYEAIDSQDSDAIRLNLFNDGKLIPYSEILLVDKSELLADAKIFLPFWYTFPIISWIARLFFRPPKRKRNNKTKTEAELYNEKNAAESIQDAETAAIAKNPIVSKKVALREAARNAESVFVPENSTLDRELVAYEHQWNQKIGQETHDNLTEDVNSLIRDYIKKILRTINPANLTADRIKNLAESLSKTSGLKKIPNQDALIMYTQLYILKIVKTIPI